MTAVLPRLRGLRASLQWCRRHAQPLPPPQTASQLVTRLAQHPLQALLEYSSSQWHQ